MVMFNAHSSNELSKSEFRLIVVRSVEDTLTDTCLGNNHLESNEATLLVFKASV